AVPYLIASGARAQQRFAYREAVEHFEATLTTLACLPRDDERVQQELAVRLALGVPLAMLHGYAADDVRANYECARELCAVAGNAQQAFEILYALWFARAALGEGAETSALLAEMEQVAQQLNKPECNVAVQSAAIRTAVWQARFTDAIAPMARMRAIS